jgi:hypothetical protein
MPTDDKISALPSGTIDSLRALFPISIGIPSSPQTIRSEFGEVATFLGINNGWYPVNDTWTYNNANGINVPSGATLKYQKGWGIRFKQGGSFKYAYMTTVADTLLTVNGGSDYSVANAAITDVAVSLNPNNAFGFPSWFNFSPTLGGFSAAPSVTMYRFTVMGRTVIFPFRQGIAGTSDATTFTMTLPIMPANVASGSWFFPLSPIQDNGAIPTSPGLGIISAGTITMDLYKTIAFGAWTASSTKYANGIAIYEI